MQLNDGRVKIKNAGNRTFPHVSLDNAGHMKFPLIKKSKENLYFDEFANENLAKLQK